MEGRSFSRVGFAGVAVLWLVLSSASSALGDEMLAGRTERNIAYRAYPARHPNPSPGQAPNAARVDHSYDLFPAAAPGGALVLFVHSRFWRERQPDRLIEAGFVRGLVEAGHSVAVLRHPLGPAGRHPVAIESVARGVATILARVDAGEFDPDRVFLAGHSSGAQLALLLALDPAWLAAEGRTIDRFAGVIALSGIYDLSPRPTRSEEEEAFYAAAFPDAKARISASPDQYVNPSLPAILVMNAAKDIPGSSSASQRFVEEMRAKGQPAIEYFVANGRDYYSMLDLTGRGASPHIFELIDARPRDQELPESWSIAATWRHPPFSTEDFHQRFASLLRRYPADAHFLDVLNRLFRSAPGAPDRLRVGEYAAVDLLAMLEAMGAAKVGRGEWLELTNVRGETAVFSMAQIRRLAPRVVVGVDGEANLFRATDLYHTRRRYSWVDARERRIDMARPLGGFLFFPGEEPLAQESSALIGRYGLTSDSFRLHPSDPLAPIADLPPLVKHALTGGHHCLSCHRFRGVGGSAFHLRGRDGAAVAGFALPLERYPEVVWKRFVFEQAQVAEEVGATAVDFAPGAAQALYDAVVHERTTRRIEAWSRPDRDRVAPTPQVDR